MKKRLLAILMLLAMLCTLIAVAEEAACEHEWSVYTDNGDGTHTVACELCGAKGKTEQHAPDWSGDTHDLGNGKHGMNCMYCGSKEAYPNYHGRYCTNPEGICIYCGVHEAETETWDIYHNNTMVDNGDGTCSLFCVSCENKGTPYPHGRNCQDRADHCGGCGAYVEGLEATHFFNAKCDFGDGTHGYICEACGVKDAAEAHTRKCTDPEGYCGVCDVKVAGLEATHAFSDTVKDLGDGTHGYVCADCGATRDVAAHTRKCSDPEDACAICGAKCEGLEAEHVWTVYVDNGNDTHTVTCELCGEAGETTEHDPDWGKGFSNLGYGLHGMQCKLCDSNEVWLSTHTRMCSDPEGLCITCGADEEETETWLVYHYYYMHDNGDGTHCSICDTCGDVTRSDPHYNYCDGPEGKCNACGAAVEGLERQHYFYSYIDNGDGTHCAVCDACGFVDKENWETHYAKCSDPEGKCAACGAACEEVLHYWDNTPKDAWDGTHVYTCLDCGETRAERHNWDWGVVVKAATETEEGARLFKCQTCDATRRESIAKLPSTQPEVTETPAEVTEPETPVTDEVTDETTEEELPVIIEEVVLEEGKLTAELVLEEEVQQLEKLFLRVEYQLANGETRVEVIELDETMKFALDIDADVVHILIELTDTADVLEPGDWTVYGRYEMDVK